MKATLTVSIDEELFPKAEQYAQERGLSLSELIETLLRTATESPRKTFSQRWRGAFQSANRDDERYRSLAKRYL